MADAAHKAELLKGVAAWNAWRAANPTVAPDLSSENLARSKFRGGFDFTGANCRHTVFESGDLRDANFAGADLYEANFEGAILLRVNFEGAKLDYACFDNAILRGAVFIQTNTQNATFRSADAREAVEWVPNQTIAPGIRVSWNKWHVLRSHYTGPMFALHFIFLVVFLIPYVVEAVGWSAANHAQMLFAAQMHGLTQQINQVAQRNQVDMGSVTKRIERITPCLAEKCEQVPVWWLLLALNQGWKHWLPGIVLLIYNACRALLTVRVSQLRDEEQNTDTSPVQAGWTGYGWLWYPHLFMSWAVYVALSLLFVHLWGVLGAAVSLPSR